MPSPTWNPTDDPWIGRWSLVATLTTNIEADDHRLPTIKAMFKDFDTAYRGRNHQRFIQTGQRLRALIEVSTTR